MHTDSTAPHTGTSPQFLSDGHPYFVSKRRPLNTFPIEEDGDIESFLSPLDDPEMDQDQKATQEVELNDLAAAGLEATSAPESTTSPFVSDSDLSQVELSMSPAAMFLSSFSPLASANPVSLPDDEGEEVSGHVLGPIIGRGGFSIIRRASSAHGGTVAVKIVRRSDLIKQVDFAGALKRITHEAAVWSSLSHEHILPLFSFSHTSYADFFVTLYCPAGSLFDILKRDGRPALPQDDAGLMFRQVVRGLRYMHEVAGYVHGDMKLENVLVDEMGVCRIGDFGMAKKIGLYDDDDNDDFTGENDDHEASGPKYGHALTSRMQRSYTNHRGSTLHMSLIQKHRSGPRNRTSSPLPSSNITPSAFTNQGFQPGSLPYAAPELLLPSYVSKLLPNPAQDMWALGVMLYALLTGRLPFTDAFEPRLQMKILNGVFELPQNIGRGAERVLKGCLDRVVSTRWTIAVVDEVAWGVGWGSAGDDATPSGTPERNMSQSPPHHTAAVFNADHLEIPDYLRSSSRIPRSRSQSASIRSRSRSHPPLHRMHEPTLPESLINPPQPTFSALTHSILRTVSTSSSVSSESAMNDSAILMTPTHSNDHHRGRAVRSRHDVQSISRSTSPLDIPTTPTDHRGDIRLRGRKLSPREHGGLRKDGDLIKSPWPLSPQSDCRSESSRRPSSRCASHDASWRVERERDIRSGSMPPKMAAPIGWTCTSDDPFMSTGIVSTPRYTPAKNPHKRSCSVGFNTHPRVGWRMARPGQGL